jgi:uncharacterized protein (DUF697 family)
MARPAQSGIARFLQAAVEHGLKTAYETVKVGPREFLVELRVEHQLDVATYDDLFSIPVESLDHVAEHIIRSGMKMAAASGAGFGVGGAATLVPDLGALGIITVRTLQKLSLVYGFKFVTDEELAEFWIAVATAAGVNITREQLEKQVVGRVVPRLIRRVAAKASSEIAQKWSARVLPVISSVVGATLNSWFVRAWGRRAKRYFRDKHMCVREQRQVAARLATKH